MNAIDASFDTWAAKTKCLTVISYANYIASKDNKSRHYFIALLDGVRTEISFLHNYIDNSFTTKFPQLLKHINHACI